MHADISAIVPYFNADSTIERAIESIQNQTLKIKEVIIIDDGSKDKNALNNILQFKHYDFELKIITLEKNSGASAARNAGIKAATGTYISFLDADDIWLPEKIETQYRIMVASGVYVSCHHYIHDFTASTLNKSGAKNIRMIGSNCFIFGNPIATPTVMARKDKFALFDESLNRMEDYKCWIENSQINKILFIDDYLSAGFKPPIGTSGLSQSLELMHNGCLSAIRKLRDARKVTFSFFMLAITFELIKYPLRCLRHKLRKMR